MEIFFYFNDYPMLFFRFVQGYNSLNYILLLKESNNNRGVSNINDFRIIPIHQLLSSNCSVLPLMNESPMKIAFIYLNFITENFFITLKPRKITHDFTFIQKFSRLIVFWTPIRHIFICHPKRTF